MEQESLNAARVLMGDSLGFHIVFVMFGIGLPVVFSLLEFIGIKYKKPRLIDAAKFISYIATVLVITGVVSGTLIAIQMSLMWPKLPEFGSAIIGLPFMFEGYAFVLEALFLGYYMYTWDKIKGYRHWLLSLPIILGAFLSAFFITSVNSWMNKPGGFDIVDGKIVNADVWAGILTPTTFFMVSHSVLGYYLAIFLAVIAGYAWYIMRHKPKGASKKTAEYIISRFALISFAVVLSIGAIGHFQTQYLATSQPRKLAAIELVPQTTTNAPYIIGGELSADGQSVEGGLRIPNGLSILAGNSPNTEIKGLNEFPKEDWPNLIVNTFF
ncbi:MAG TPA: cytochrome ubiquinol oxidase subunit I, partial [Candidatus Saccharibacteria bacterium]|nr:cytochrome ubiquinol oxidase subunit I [Candidatus Saccharibacteria bacterium]